MDRFCAYNARFGHAAGDALLIDLGSAISRVLSPESAGARLHADRFALLVPRPLLDEAVFLTRFSHRPEGAFCSVRSGVYEIGDVAPGSVPNVGVSIRIWRAGEACPRKTAIV